MRRQSNNRFPSSYWLLLKQQYLTHYLLDPHGIKTDGPVLVNANTMLTQGQRGEHFLFKAAGPCILGQPHWWVVKCLGFPWLTQLLQVMLTAVIRLISFPCCCLSCSHDTSVHNSPNMFALHQLYISDFILTPGHEGGVQNRQPFQRCCFVFQPSRHQRCSGVRKLRM